MSFLVKISDLDISNKTVLIREDYNVPIKDGRVVDDTRIAASLPTLEKVCAEKNTKIIIVSHLGRPVEGKYDDSLSLRAVADCLSQLLAREVPLIKNWIDGIDFSGHDVVLCENIRFEPGEPDNDDGLARKIAALCDVYVNDAFATAHRVQASTHGVVKYAKVSCAGPLLITELKALSGVLRNPARPLAAIVGGAKISTKLMLLESLIDVVDELIAGGAMANTFLKAAGHNIGQSPHETDLVDAARNILEQAEEKECAIRLPVDAVCAKECSADAQAAIKPLVQIADDDLILDIGPATIAILGSILANTGTIIWNGPLGVFEFDKFGEGTRAIAAAIASSSAYSVVGGGDTLAAAAKYNVAKDIDYISTGGGAFLTFLEGRKLPAIAMLEEAARSWSAMEWSREL